MIAFTIACGNYVPMACASAASFRVVHPESRIVLIVVERSSAPFEMARDFFDEMIPVKELLGDQTTHLMFCHNMLESSTVIKSAAFLHLANQNELEDIVFLDPDMWIASRFDDLSDGLATNPVLVTPHLLEDHFELHGLVDVVCRVINCGVFNLGFLAVRPSPPAIDFLRWWDQRLMQLCRDDPSRGLYCDQKWMDLAIGLFDIGILRSDGYNVAHWNIADRPITHLCDKFFIKGQPLKCVHFSGILSGRDLRLFEQYAAKGDPIFDIRARFLIQIEEIARSFPASQEWSFARFHSGELITDQARRTLYESRPFRVRGGVGSDPFRLSNQGILELSG